jgi:propionyl-CoA synthetase
VATYDDVYRFSTEDPEGFWLQAARELAWYKAPARALDDSHPPFYRWFPDGEINVAYNALDRHVDAGRGEQAALIYDSPVTGVKRTYTYAGLRDEVAAFAGVLPDLGVKTGDRVVIYMPMVPEAAIAMLACARLGAVHSVVFGGFAAPRQRAARQANQITTLNSSAALRFAPLFPDSDGIDGPQPQDPADRGNRADADDEDDAADNRGPAGWGDVGRA